MNFSLHLTWCMIDCEYLSNFTFLWSLNSSSKYHDKHSSLNILYNIYSAHCSADFWNLKNA